MNHQDQTEAEERVGVIPTNPEFPPGDPRRYGAIPNSDRDCTEAVQKAIKVSQGLT